MEEIRQILTSEQSTSSPNPPAPSEATPRPSSLPLTSVMAPLDPGPPPLPLKPHWFFMRQQPDKPKQWLPFSLLDSNELECALSKGQGIVTVCGGRFEVDLSSKIMYPVYWNEADIIHVRRCTWFFKSEGDPKFTPYEEDVALLLEESFQRCHNLNKWNRAIDLGYGQYVKIYNSTLMTHTIPSGFTDEWGNISDSTPRPRMVKRGADQVNDGAFEAGETSVIDHVIFVVHGIGAVCDFRMRTVEQCLDDFRSMSNNLIQAHYGDAFQTGDIGRVEFLPISWHSKLHGETTGLDQKLQKITIQTISRVRDFSNDTILDALLYTSPVYCQTIVDQVGSELNRLYNLFKQRNPTFTGTIGLAGHSLGSLILYDILSHQNPSGYSPRTNPAPSPAATPTTEPDTIEDLFEKQAIDVKYIEELKKADIDMKALELCTEADLLGLGLPIGPVKKIVNALSRFPKRILRRKQSYTRAEFLVAGNEGTGQLTVNYPQLEFNPDCFFAMGSPIAMFIVVRGNERLGNNFRLPTCPRYYNIYHPCDPIAYRMEPLIDPDHTLESVLIPHHKGRKRMHLEVKESIIKVSNEVKQKLVDAVSVLSMTLQRRDSTVTAKVDENTVTEVSETSEEAATGSEEVVANWSLNAGKRVDYVLQERPLESFNEYLSVLFSHACYWESEDTILLMVKEHYALRGVFPSTAAKASSLMSFYPMSPTSPTEPLADKREIPKKPAQPEPAAPVSGYWNPLSSVAGLSTLFSRSDSNSGA